MPIFEQHILPIPLDSDKPAWSGPIHTVLVRFLSYHGGLLEPTINEYIQEALPTRWTRIYRGCIIILVNSHHEEIIYGLDNFKQGTYFDKYTPPTHK